MSRNGVNIELHKHIDSLFRFALSLTADFHISEELTQECLCRAHQKVGQLVNEGATKAWLFQMLVNLWRDRLRREKRAASIEHCDPAELPSREKPSDEMIAQNEEVSYLLRVMQQLPARQRQVLYLRAVEDLSIQEIGETLGISYAAVKSSLSAARKTMSQKLAGPTPSNP